MYQKRELARQKQLPPRSREGREDLLGFACRGHLGGGPKTTTRIFATFAASRWVFCFSRHEGWQGCREEAAGAAFEGELLQTVHGAREARRKPEGPQPLRVVPAIGRELLEQAGLEPRRRQRRLALEGALPSAGNPPVQRPPQRPLGKVPGQPEAQTGGPR